MRRHRRIILIVAIAVGGGSIAGTTWYAHRLHSEAYRRQVERDVTAFFALPTTVGSVRGRTFDSRDFVNVAVRLPGNGATVFECATATWIEEQIDRNYLALESGLLVLGDSVWADEQYRSLVRQGIGTDLKALDLRGIRLTDFRLRFEKNEFGITCSGVSGEIDLKDPTLGRAELTAHQLNGVRIDEGVRIRASFVPDGGIEVRDIRLSVPSIPLPVLQLDNFLGGAVTGGAFAGSIEYQMRGANEPPEARFSGRIDDAELAELTRIAPYGPYQGNVSLQVESARFTGRLLTHFEGRGSIRELEFASFAPFLQMPKLDGRASFVFDDVNIAMGVVNRVRLNGAVKDVSLEQLLNRWADGGATGSVSVRVSNFELIGEEIRSADIQIEVIPPSGADGYVDRKLLLDVAESAFGYEWPSALPKRLLPERVRYVAIGARLLVRDNQLRILGTHGTGNRALVTIRDPVFGQEIAVAKERTDTIDLGPYVRQVFARMRSYQPEDVRDWIRNRQVGEGD